MLILTAIAISFIHTVAGPDHYLPFIVLSKSRGWSVGKTLWWTIVCGCGHVWSSVLLALGGAAIGWSLSSVKWLESVRGGVAGWLFLLFGLVYAIWGLLKAKQNYRHKHFDLYEDGSLYVYEHKHGQAVAPQERHKVTPWVLFIIFLLGPCEPMIPLLYLPAAKSSWGAMAILITVYTIFTLLTMVAMVLAGYYGTKLFTFINFHKYAHALGGATIFICGVGMLFLNW